MLLIPEVMCFQWSDFAKLNMDQIACGKTKHQYGTQIAKVSIILENNILWCGIRSSLIFYAILTDNKC